MADEHSAVTRGELTAIIQAIATEIKRLAAILEGPPFPGLDKRVNDYLVEVKTIENERIRQHKSNTTRLNLIIGGLVCLAGYITIALAIFFAQHSKDSSGSLKDHGQHTELGANYSANHGLQ